MRSKQLLVIVNEALQLKDELFGLESVRDVEKKKEHDKLGYPEPTDLLGRFWWEHDREKYIHDAKEAQLGKFNVPAYNFFKSIQSMKDKFILLKKKYLAVFQIDNPEDRNALERLNHEVIEIGDYLSGINDISIIIDCYRPIELSFRFLSLSLVKTKGAIDAFNKNPNMQTYKELCSNRDYLVYEIENLAYDINLLQRRSAESKKPRQDRIEAAYALNKVLDSSKNDLALLDNEIENLRYKHSGILYEGLDDLQDSYEGSVLSYLKCYWIITLSYLYAQFMGLSVTATSSAEQLDETVMEHSIDDEEEGYGAAAYAH